MAQKISVYILSLLLLCSAANARIMQLPTTDRFENQIDFTVTGITTPKVVRYETVESLGSFVALQASDSGNFVPVKMQTNSIETPWNLPIESSSNLLEGSLRNLQDQNLNTFVSFDTSGDFLKTLQFNNPTNHKISELHLNLDLNSNKPKQVTIQAQVRGSDNWQTIVNQQPYNSVIRFPEIQPVQLRLTFLAHSFLRITELEWTTRDRAAQRVNTISFYAQENNRYRLFTQPSFGQSRFSTQINTPVNTDATTPDFNLPSSVRNPNYDRDFDNDGIFDTQDLCPREADTTNADADKNGRGDACEDPDQDGFNSAKDNCPFVPNRSQTDSDQDGLGDACDPTEDRVTEQSGWWINLSFGIMILVLLGFVARSAWPTQKPKKK